MSKLIKIDSVGFFGITRGNIFRQKHFVVDASTDLCIQVASKKDQLKLLKLLSGEKNNV